MRRLLPLLLLLTAATAPARAQNIAGRLDAALLRAQDTLAESFGRSLPLPSASAGVSYAFDPATGNFERQPTTFGQVYLDRADTLGAKRVNVQFLYEYVKLDELSGEDASDLRDPTPIYVPGKAAAIRVPRLDVKAVQHQFLFALTYGITENFEATVALPLLYNVLDARARVAAVGIRTDGAVVSVDQTVEDNTRPFGVGDLFLRAKYRIVDEGPVHVAANLLLRIPTGDQDDLQGIGFVELAPTLIASTRVFEPAPWARLQGHLNAGVGFDTEDVGASEARWGIGLDWGITQRITAAIAILGRNQFARVAPPGFFDFPRCRTQNLLLCASDQSVRGGTAPLFGLSGARPDYYDLSIGGRGSVWRDTVFAFVNVVLPLNDGFVRTDPIPLIGVEATF
jgi:hypothetical protein